MARTKDKSQRGRRRYHTFRDQHGRKWGATIEIETGDPCGVIKPVGWAPPHPLLRPAQKYIHPVPEELGLLHIDYAQWIEDLRLAREHWEERKLSFAQSMYGEKTAEAIASPPPELLRLLGAPPCSTDVPRCCQAGNKWALGLSPNKPAWAAELFPDAVAVAQRQFPDVEADDDEAADAFVMTEAGAERIAETIDDRDEVLCVFCQQPATGELSDGTAACQRHLEKFADAEAEAERQADKASGRRPPTRRRDGRFARQEA